MVPRVQKVPADDFGFDLVAFDSRSPLKSRNLDYEFDERSEARKQRNRILRVIIYLSLLVLMCTACAWAAYQYAWYSYWKVHVHGEDVYKPIEDHILHIGIISPPGNHRQRFQARNTWVHEAKRFYQDKKVKIEFLIGQVPIQGNNLRGQRDVVASEDEKKMEHDLQGEEHMFNDISRVPIVEENSLYQTDKGLWLLRSAVSWKARFVMLTTDTRTVNVEKVLAALEQHTPVDPPVYFGMNYNLEDAPHPEGMKRWYFHGECFGISGELAYNIVNTHRLHTLSFPVYGSGDMAANVARWVKYEDDLRIQANVAPVTDVQMPDMQCRKIELPQSAPPPDPCAPVR